MFFFPDFWQRALLGGLSTALRRAPLSSHQLLWLLAAVSHCPLLLRIALGWEPPHWGGRWHLPWQPTTVTDRWTQQACNGGQFCRMVYASNLAQGPGQGQTLPQTHPCLACPSPTPCPCSLQASPDECPLSKGHIPEALRSCLFPGNPTEDRLSTHVRRYRKLKKKFHQKNMPLLCIVLLHQAGPANWFHNPLTHRQNLQFENYWSLGLQR